MESQPQPLALVVVGLRFGRQIVEQARRLDPGMGIGLAGVCDLDQRLARETAASYGVPAYPDLDAVLADPRIAVVGLFTGPVERADLVRRAVRAGKHVLTTKPFELDAGRALAVLREAEELGRVVHLNSPAPVPTADLTTIARWREVHGLGRPVAARAETWVSYRESADGSWYDDPARCPVAPILRLGIYLINDLLRMYGPAQEVQVAATRLFTGRPTADNAQLGIRFADGALATVFASFCVADGEPYQDALVLNFERGTIRRRTVAGSGIRLELTTVDPYGAAVREVALIDGHVGAYQWDALARAVRGESLPGATTPEEIAAGIQVLEAAARAERSGRTEAVEFPS